MFVASFLTLLVVAVVSTLAVRELRQRRRDRTRRTRLISERLQRAPEDVCWRLCRHEAYADAMYLSLRKTVDTGGDRLLRDLGIAVDHITAPRLEVVE